MTLCEVVATEKPQHASVWLPLPASLLLWHPLGYLFSFVKQQPPNFFYQPLCHEKDCEASTTLPTVHSHYEY